MRPPAVAGADGGPAEGGPADGSAADMAADMAADIGGGGADSIGGLPPGFRIELDPGTKKLTGDSLFGGSPARVMRLTPAGMAALAELEAGPVRTAAAGQLARRLTDAGLAHPVPPSAGWPSAGWPSAGSPSTGCDQPGAATVTVVIPVRDRAAMLERCLAAAGSRYPVVVVDDGSADPDAVAAIAARHGAAVSRRVTNGGPAAARNTGLTGLATDLIAFLDSDCVPPDGWIGRLAAHFTDPQVGAVAPRIVPITASPAAQRRADGAPASARYAAACGSLDLGAQSARVLPGGRVGYVPTAALVVRRSALDSAASGRPPFDPALRCGEDVDLIWRLHDAGWRIRYEPAVQVPHDGPVTWAGLLGRRFRYGTSAGPLARRHPANLAPLVLHPWPALTVAAVLARRPAAAAAGLAGGWLDLAAALRRAGLPADGVPAAALTAARQTWLGVGRYATQFCVPAVALALARPGGSSARRRWGRRIAAASLLIGPALTDYAQRKPDLDPVTFALARIADDICYGAGVWAGCLRERTLVPVTPRVSLRMLRLSGRRDGKD